MILDLTPDQLFFLFRLSAVGVLLVVGLLAIIRRPKQQHFRHRKVSVNSTLSGTNGHYVGNGSTQLLGNGNTPSDGSADLNQDAEVVIVGSGILGSAMACVLARDGRKVVVVERDLSEPDRIVGELLQPGGCLALDDLQLSHCTEGIDSQKVMGYIIHDVMNGSRVRVPYPESCGGGRTFHHGRFVTALRKAAAAEPNVRYIEGNVMKLLEDEDKVIIGVEYREKESEKVRTLLAPLTIVADGCFSRMRRGLISQRPQTTSHFIGLLMKDCPQAETNNAELVITNAGPVLIYRISSSWTRVLVDVRGPLPTDLKAYLADTIYPLLPNHIKEPFIDAVSNESIRTMPNSFLPAAPLGRSGVLCLGDAFNMRHALTGGGMSVALHDVVLCRRLLTDIPNLNDLDRVDRAAAKLYTKRKQCHSFVVNVLAMALYELFAADDTDEGLKDMKWACLEYFRIGGVCVTGPVDLLSVLRPKPMLLIGHFFAVALYAICITVRSKSMLYLHQSLFRAVRILYRACGVIFPLIWCEVKTLLA